MPLSSTSFRPGPPVIRWLIPGMQRQRGSSLLFCLLFLTVLTMLAVSGMESTVLEQRMAANTMDRQRAFHAAESALQAAEAWLMLQDTRPIDSTDGSSGVWQHNVLDPTVDDSLYWWEYAVTDVAWWSANGTATAVLPGLAGQPRYVIEDYKTVNTGRTVLISGVNAVVQRIFYRITALGWGRAATVSAAMQSSLVRTYAFALAADGTVSPVGISVGEQSDGRQSWRQLW